MIAGVFNIVAEFVGRRFFWLFHVEFYQWANLSRWLVFRKLWHQTIVGHALVIRVLHRLARLIINDFLLFLEPLLGKIFRLYVIHVLCLQLLNRQTTHHLGHHNCFLVLRLWGALGCQNLIIRHTFARKSSIRLGIVASFQCRVSTLGLSFPYIMGSIRDTT